MKIFNKISIVTVLIISLVSVLTGPITVHAAATVPVLGAAASFSVLAGLSMDAAGAGTTVSADLGLSPGLAISRTGPWTVGGTEYFGPSSLAFTAKADALLAYNDLASQSSSGTWSLNATPVAGVWTAADSPTFNGTLTLNGTASSVWVFQLTTDFTFTGNVVLGAGVNPCNVFWAVGRDVTIHSGGAGTQFAGTLIAGNSVTLTSGATVNGQILSSILTDGSLTTDGNTISGCAVGHAVIVPGGAPSHGTITVVKMVINDNGGTKTVADFPLSVNGTLVVSSTTYSYPASGVYTVTETTDPNYTRTFSGDCDINGSINLNTNENKFCIVTNDDIGAPVVVPPVPPIIAVVKVPSPLALPTGPGAVTYTYTLRNIGTVPVTNITMVGDTCSPIVLISGDTNGDSKLDVSETWVHTCSTTLTETHTNTVVATGWANGLSATDIASATVVVGAPTVPPLIHVTKVPNPLTLLAGGGIVTYTKRVTNPGTVALSNVRLTDDKCDSVKYVSGDTNGDSKLDTTETWIYTCQANLTKTTINTVTASGDANGLTARDFAIATVTVATAVPSLPNTGIGPNEKSIPWDIIIAGILILTLISFVAVPRLRQGFDGQ